MTATFRIIWEINGLKILQFLLIKFRQTKHLKVEAVFFKRKKKYCLMKILKGSLYSICRILAITSFFVPFFFLRSFNLKKCVPFPHTAAVHLSLTILLVSKDMYQTHRTRIMNMLTNETLQQLSCHKFLILDRNLLCKLANSRSKRFKIVLFTLFIPMFHTLWSDKLYSRTMNRLLFICVVDRNLKRSNGNRSVAWKCCVLAIIQCFDARWAEMSSILDSCV